MLKRIFISVFISIVVLLGSLSLISYQRIQESIKQSHKERLSAAETIAGNIDRALENHLTRLYDISLSGKIDFNDGNWEPEQSALKEAYEYSIFSDGVFLLDRYGSVVQLYPHRDSGRVNLMNVPAVSKAISETRPVISNVYTIEPIKKKVIFAIVPLRDRHGDIVGSAVGEINPDERRFVQSIATNRLMKQIKVELVDNQGYVIASNSNNKVFNPTDHNSFYATHIAEKKSYIGTCHRCHEDRKSTDKKSKDIIVLAPLQNAPWAVSIREPEESVLVLSTQLKNDFLLLVFVSLASALMLAAGLSTRIVRPIKALTAAAERIGKGDLSVPVVIQSSDEIGILAQSLDETRNKLAVSLQNIQRNTEELEIRVKERTNQLEKKQLAISTLLKRVITSQEDERKRIARELHDESLQALSAILMDVGTCKLRPDLITTSKISEIYDNITKIITEMTNLTQNLRPTVLDDLGFMAAITWVLDHALTGKGIQYHLHIHKLSEQYLTPEFQITVFRIMQEMSTNIARHSDAENVFVHMMENDRQIMISVEDDGKGFDPHLLAQCTLDKRGLGILGMKERAALLKGSLTICSSPEAGTLLQLKIPLNGV